MELFTTNEIVIGEILIIIIPMLVDYIIRLMGKIVKRFLKLISWGIIVVLRTLELLPEFDFNKPRSGWGGLFEHVYYIQK